MLLCAANCWIPCIHSLGRAALQDFPNGWAPLNWMMVVGLHEAGRVDAVPEARAMGLEIGRRWLLSGLVGYQAHGYMFEKMDVLGVGKGGKGGEYLPQTGFGW